MSADAVTRMHLARSAVVGLAALLEDRVDLLLAAAHGRDVDAVWFLYTEAFPRVPTPARMSMLKRLIDQTAAPLRRTHKRQLTFAEARPLLYPLLELVFKTRNVLAHAIDVPATSTGMTDFSVRHRRRGQVEQETFEIGWLETLAGQGGPLVATLDDLLFRVADIDVLGKLYGFDDETTGAR